MPLVVIDFLVAICLVSTTDRPRVKLEQFLIADLQVAWIVIPLISFCVTIHTAFLNGNCVMEVMIVVMLPMRTTLNVVITLLVPVLQQNTNVPIINVSRSPQYAIIKMTVVTTPMNSAVVSSTVSGCRIDVGFSMY